MICLFAFCGDESQTPAKHICKAIRTRVLDIDAVFKGRFRVRPGYDVTSRDVWKILVASNTRRTRGIGCLEKVRAVEDQSMLVLLLLARRMVRERLEEGLRQRVQGEK